MTTVSLCARSSSGYVYTLYEVAILRSTGRILEVGVGTAKSPCIISFVVDSFLTAQSIRQTEITGLAALGMAAVGQCIMIAWD